MAKGVVAVTWQQAAVQRSNVQVVHEWQPLGRDECHACPACWQVHVHSLCSRSWSSLGYEQIPAPTQPNQTKPNQTKTKPCQCSRH
jgi:hypothetical protein